MQYPLRALPPSSFAIYCLLFFALALAAVRPVAARQQITVSVPPLPLCKPEITATVDAEAALQYGEQAMQENHPKKAACWWKAAVAKGSHAAEFRLGLFYERGQDGTRDHAEAMRLLNLAAAGGFVPARDTLVCFSSDVQRAMKELLVDASNDPQAQATKLAGVTAKEQSFAVIDVAPGDFSSDTRFSCTARLQGPVTQTYEIARVAGRDAYTVTLAYAGFLGGPRFSLSRTYSRDASAPVW